MWNPPGYSQPPSYLDWSAIGRGSWWRYLSGTVLIVLGGTVGGFVLGVVLAVVRRLAAALGVVQLTVLGDNAADSPAGVLFLGLTAFYLPLLLATLLVVRFLHRRPASTVITPFRRLNWRMIALGAGLWLAAMGTVQLISLLLPTSNKGAVRWNFQPGVFWPALALACTLLVVQTSAEELVFRGYLLQLFGKLSRNTWIMATFSAMIFAVPHLWNPEVSRATGLQWILALAIYAAPGFAWAVVSIRAGTVELALGAHWLNNFGAVILITGENSILGATSLWVERPTGLVEAAVSVVIAAGVFILLAWRIRGRGQLRPLEPSWSRHYRARVPEGGMFYRPVPRTRF